MKSSPLTRLQGRLKRAAMTYKIFALSVSNEYPVGKASFKINQDMLNRFQEVSTLPESAKKQIYMVINSLIRDFKTGQAYATN